MVTYLPADNGKEMLSMNEVLLYLLRSSRPVFCESELQRILRLEETDWQDLVDEVRGSIVTLPGMVSDRSMHSDSSILYVCTKRGETTI